MFESVSSLSFPTHLALAAKIETAWC